MKGVELGLPICVSCHVAKCTPWLTEIELHRKDGARLRLHAPETSLSTIVQSFLEAR